MKSKVYFSKNICAEKVLEMYQLSGKALDGKVAVKVHSGETGNQNFIGPEMWKPLIDFVDGTVVECNTAYKGTRHLTKLHMETLRNHGWSNYFNVDILDGEGPDLVLDIPNGKNKIKGGSFGMSKMIDLTNNVYGRLTVLRKDNERLTNSGSYWIC